MIIDATTDPARAKEIEAVCREYGAEYVRFPPSFHDRRARQWNLGVRTARTDWILKQDDDDDIIVEFDHAAFDRAAANVDFLWNGVGNCIICHRRENFLRVGGYPEDMVMAEDITFSWILRAVSRGALEGDIYRDVEVAQEQWETFRGSLRRVSNMFWYSFTLLRYLERSPTDQRTNILFGVTVLPFRAVRRQLPRWSAVVVMPVFGLGLLVGFGWHHIRKALDSRFRQSLRLYRGAIRAARAGQQVALPSLR